MMTAKTNIPMNATALTSLYTLNTSQSKRTITEIFTASALNAVLIVPPAVYPLLRETITANTVEEITLTIPPNNADTAISEPYIAANPIVMIAVLNSCQRKTVCSGLTVIQDDIDFILEQDDPSLRHKKAEF